MNDILHLLRTDTVIVAGAAGNQDVLAQFGLHMATAKTSPTTVRDRLKILQRLAKALGSTELIHATPTDLQRFQESYGHLSRASVDIYTRHVQAFYRWAVTYGWIETDPTLRMVTVKVRKGVPHPISHADLRITLACTTGSLRIAFILAAFAGLRCGEICLLRGEDLQLDAAQPLALIHGKGDRERLVPLLPPVVDELRLHSARGPVVTRRDGKPYSPEQLSIAAHKHLRALGVKSTLHSCRHYFATEVVKITRDVLLVRDLLGHSSLATTQIYMQSTIDGTQDRLAAMSLTADDMLANRPTPRGGGERQG